MKTFLQCKPFSTENLGKGERIFLCRTQRKTEDFSHIRTGNFETMVLTQASIFSFTATASSSEHYTLENKTIKITI